MELKCTDCDSAITEKVAKFSVDKYGKELCYTCQEKEKAKSNTTTSTTTETNSDDKDYVIIKGKKHILYKGLLNRAHNMGLISLEMTNFGVDFEKKSAYSIVRATFKYDGQVKVYDGFGSSTPENTGTLISSHFVEMSQTRAKARALRDALNIGEAAAEEMPQ